MSRLADYSPLAAEGQPKKPGAKQVKEDGQQEQAFGGHQSEVARNRQSAQTLASPVFREYRLAQIFCVECTIIACFRLLVASFVHIALLRGGLRTLTKMRSSAEKRFL